jgi:hypothetical protein
MLPTIATGKHQTAAKNPRGKGIFFDLIEYSKQSEEKVLRELTSVEVRCAKRKKYSEKPNFDNSNLVFLATHLNKD